MGVIAYLGGKKMICVAVAAATVGSVTPTIVHKARTHIARPAPKASPVRTVANAGGYANKQPAAVPCVNVLTGIGSLANYGTVIEGIKLPSLAANTTIVNNGYSIVDDDTSFNGPFVPGGGGGNIPGIPTSPGMVPEPDTWAMLLVGFAAIGISTRKKELINV